MSGRFNKLCVLIFSCCLAPTMAANSSSTDVASNDVNWWQHAVFYQIYPRSFMDSNGDGIGDLKGIIAKLPYLADTGLTAIWLSPIFLSPMVDFGYDIADFKVIQPEYGTMADFEELISEATKRGIKVVLDFVPNHTSNQCEWFQKSVKRAKGYENFYVWADGKKNEQGELLPPNNWQSVFYGSAWEWNGERQQFYLHQFSKEQPDLNYRNADVVEAMDDVLRYWLDKGVSGFRVDAVNHLYETPDLHDEPLSGATNDKNSYNYTKHIHTTNLPEVYDLVRHWRAVLDNYTRSHGGVTRIMMTEAYAELKLLMDYYENADGRRGAHFPFNFLLITDLERTSDARDFAFNVQKWLTYMPRGHVANWVMGNHDQPRMATRYGEERVDAMNMLLLTLPGVAVTYNGEEIGMQDYRDISWEHTVDPLARNIGPALYKTVSRDPVRTPFQWNSAPHAGFSTAAQTWLPVHPDYATINLEMQQNAAKSHYKVYKALIGLRNLPQLREGRCHVEAINRDVFVLKRALKGHPVVLTIINIGSTQQNISLAEIFDAPSKLIVLVAGSTSNYEQGVTVQANALSLAANEALILSGNLFSAAERRAAFRTLLQMAQVILAGLLMYKLWHNKWNKLNFNT